MLSLLARIPGSMAPFKSQTFLPKSYLCFFVPSSFSCLLPVSIAPTNPTTFEGTALPWWFAKSREVGLTISGWGGLDTISSNEANLKLIAGWIWGFHAYVIVLVYKSHSFGFWQRSCVALLWLLYWTTSPVRDTVNGTSSWQWWPLPESSTRAERTWT